jgi:hypothetical protein
MSFSRGPDHSGSLLDDSRAHFDPSVCKGFDTVFNKEVPVTFVSQNPDLRTDSRVIRV